ncbi:MAG: type II toxin-antitoxin system Phd/YefM family antitoxin [Nitrospirae bacterium]|nr:type II toxin-antitoxin system Phd/YefM family antitoxin [Nitrospirota bacterium]
MKVIGAGKFKAQCLALLDEVALDHETIVVTKHGKPVAKVTPVTEKEKDLRDQLKGSILREKDLVSPLRGTWEAAS